MSETTQFDEKLNLDTATDHEIVSVSEELVQFLEDRNEELAAEHVQYLIKNQTAKKPPKVKSDPNYTKLVQINTDILAVLERIHEDMIDEQDTSINKKEKVSTSQNVFFTNNTYNNVGDKSSGFNLGIGGFGGGGVLPRIGGGRGVRPAPPIKTSDVKNQKSPKKTTKTSSIGKIGKGALKLGRLAGKAFIPLTIGLGIYDSVQGWNNANEIFGVPEEDLTTGQKLSSAVGGLVSGLTFGLVDGEQAAKDILNKFTPKEKDKSYEKDDSKRELTEIEKSSVKESQIKIIDVQSKIDNTQKSIDQHKDIIKNTTDHNKVRASIQMLGGLEVLKKSLQDFIDNEIKNIEKHRSVDSNTKSEIYNTYNNYINKNQDSAETQATKSESSLKMTPIKTSSTNQNTTNINQENITYIDGDAVQVNKNIKEQIVEKTSNNLNNQTIIFRNSGAEQNLQTIVQPLINNIISEKNKSDVSIKPLDMF